MDYQAMNVSALKALCKDRKIRGYSKLRKEGLVNALVDSEPAPSPEVARVLEGPPASVVLKASAAKREASNAKRKARNKRKARRRALRAAGYRA